MMSAVRAAQVSLGWLQGHLAEAMASGNGAEVLRLLRDAAVRSNGDMRRLVLAGRLLPPWIYQNAEQLKACGWNIPRPKEVTT